MKRISSLLVVLLFVLTAHVQAGEPTGKALVLVHGYLSSAVDWAKSGVTEQLNRAGWRFGGRLMGVRGVIRVVGGGASGSNRYYTLDLPDEAPLKVQAQWLAAYLRYVKNTLQPGAELDVVGHSAGGVVARLAMVQWPDLEVKTLITIASPHLGTDRAELGLVANNSPLGMVAPLFGGGKLNRSEGLYRDLAPARPGNLLFWLNQQKHPKARYVSVVRHGESGLLGGDNVVPTASQDMNRVPVLRGRSEVVTVPTGHSLTRQDGLIIARLLAAS